MTHINPDHPDALMLQLLAAGVSGNLGLEYPCPEGIDCGSYQFSWGEIRELKIACGDDYIYEMAVTFSPGEGLIHEQERNFLIQTFARQHLLASVKDMGFEVPDPAPDKHFRLRAGEESVHKLRTWLAGTFYISVVPEVQKVLYNWTALKKAAPENFKSLLQTYTDNPSSQVAQAIPA